MSPQTFSNLSYTTSLSVHLLGGENEEEWLISICVPRGPAGANVELLAEDQQLIPLKDIIDEYMLEPLPPEHKLNLASTLERWVQQIREAVATELGYRPNTG